MEEQLKNLGGIVFGCAVILAILSIPILFVLGSAWAATHMLQPLMVAGWVAIAADIFILFPLSIFRGLRGFTGTAIFISSFLFGLITWLLGFILTWALWGGWAVVIGILFFGGAVVPFALLATLFKAMWVPFFTVLVLSLITYGTRIFGIKIAESGSE